MSKAEKFIQDRTRNCSNALCSVEDRNGKKVFSYYQWLTPDNALEAVRIAREEVIEEAAKWLKKEIYTFAPEDKDKMIEDFKQAMKGE